MAVYFTDFSNAPVFTERWNTGNFTPTIETTSLPSGTTGSAALKIVGTSDSRYAYSWDLPGTPTGVDVEVLVRLQWSLDNTANGPRVHLHGGGTTGAENSYHFQLSTADSGINNYVVGKYLAGASTTEAGTNATVNPDTYYFIRFFYDESAGDFLYKVWSGEIGDEPVSFTAGGNDTTLNSGWVGVGAFESSGTIWVDFIGVGTDGDSAPSTFPVYEETVTQGVRFGHSVTDLVKFTESLT